MKKKLLIPRIIFSLLLIIMILVASLLLIQTNKFETLSKIKTKDKLQLQLINNSIHEVFKDIYADIKFLSQDRTLIRFLKTGNDEDYFASCQQFLSFSKVNKTYDQIRFINIDGNEIIRINVNNNKFYIVKKSELQNKKDRYYFKETIKLNRNEIYVSKFDLNIEHGKIEKPFKPTIRFGMPIFDDKGEKRGIVILNYFGNNLLALLEAGRFYNKVGSFFLINSDGYFIKSKKYKKYEFGFMFNGKRTKTFSDIFPAEWENIKKKSQGSFLTKKGFFIYSTIYPSGKSSEHYPYWKLISYIPKRSLFASIIEFNNKVYVYDIILIAFVLIGFYYYLFIERHKAKQRKRLYEAEKKFQIAFSSNPDPVTLFRLNDKIFTDVNKSFTRVMGYEEKDIIGKSPEEVNFWVNPEETKVILKTLEEKGEIQNFEAEFRTKNGEIKIGLVSSKIIKIDGIPHVLSFTKDITERKLAENIIKESEEKFRRAFYTSPDAININSLENGTFIEINQGFTKLMGFTEKDVIGKSSLDLNVWVDPSDRERLIAELNKNGEVNNLEAKFRAKNGEIKEGLMSAKIIEIKGKPYILSITRDVSEIRRIEEEKRLQERQYRSIIDNSRDAFLIFNLEGTIIEANPAALELYGYTYEEFIGLSGKEIVYPDFQYLFNKFKKVTSEGEEFFTISKDIRKDGTSFYVEVKGNRFQFRGKEHLLAIVRDISERIKAEESLRESEKKFKLLAESSPFGIIIHQNGQLLYANKAAGKILEVEDSSQCHGENIFKFVHDDFLEKSKEKTNSAITEGKTEGIIEGKFITMKGKIIDVEVTAVPLELGENGIVQVIFTDITEKKKLQAEVEKLSQVVHQSRVSIIITDLEGKIEYVNPYFESITGYKKEEVIGKNPRILNSGKYSSNFYKDLWKTISGGSVWSGEFRNRKKNGTLYWEEATITPIHDKENNIVNYCAIKTDITRRKAIELEVRKYREDLEKMVEERTRALKISEEKFRALAENSDDTIMRFDKMHRHLYVNPAVEKQTGINAKEFMGKTHKELGFPDELVKLWDSTIDKVFRTKKKENVEFQLPNGLWIDWDLLPEFDEKGEVRFIVTFGRDITKLKKLEYELNNALLKEKELNELKSQLISTISHEFRTPLTAIFSSIDLLEMFGDDWEKEKKDKQYKQIRGSINRLTQMLDDVIKINRLEKGKLFLKFEDVNLSKFVDEVVGEIGHIFTSKHKLIKEIKPHEAVAQIDRDITKIILQNLITNAVKYSPDGGDIELTLIHNNKEFIISVTDYGVGISEKDSRKIFDEFYRVEKTSHIQGTGLGLSIVKNLVEQLSGKIEVDSEPGQGTTFTVRIPRKK